VVFNYVSQSENDVNRLTTGSYNGSLSSPAKPGQTLIAWGTGIGPYATGDNTAGISHDFSKSETITAIVGGVSIPVDYAGLNVTPGKIRSISPCRPTFRPAARCRCRFP